MPFPVAAALQAGASLVGSGLSALGTSASSKKYLQGVQDTNAANLQATRETNQTQMDLATAANELNYKMFREGNSFNAQQAALERSYNSAIAQRQRLIAAGINPAALTSAGATSAVSAAGSNAASAPSLKSPTLQAPGQTASPWSEIGAGIGGSVNEFIDAQTKSEMLKQQKYQTYMASVDSSLKFENARVDLANKIADLESKHNKSALDQAQLADAKKRLEYLDSFLNYTNKNLMQDFENSVKNGKEIDSRIAMNNASVQEVYQRIQNDVRLTDAQVHNMSAQAAAAYINAHANLRLSTAQVDHLATDALYIEEQLNQLRGDRIPNALIKRLQAKVLSMDTKHRAALAKIMQMKSEQVGNKRKSFLNQAIEVILGVSTEDFSFGASMTPLFK